MAAPAPSEPPPTPAARAPAQPPVAIPASAHAAIRSGEHLFPRVQWLLFFRLAVAVVGIVLTLVVDDGEVRERSPYAILVGACALDLLYLAIARRIRDLRRFAIVQIIVDGVIESALCYLTGGVYSFAAILYFASILSASLCVSSRFSVLFASGATVALAAIQVGYHLAVIPEAAQRITLPLVPQAVLDEQRIRLGRVAAYLIAMGLALHLVAGLSSWLAAELRRTLVLYGEILQKMAEGVIAVDPQGKIIFINAEALALLQYNKSDTLVGRDFREAFRRQEDRDILDSLLAEAPMTVEVEVLMRDGERRSIETKTSILRDDHGRVRGTIGMFTDRTLKKQAEKAERRAERLEGIEALAMGIAHEVRNPLASIRGCVQELGRLDYLGDDERQLARIVCRESDRLDAIIGEFLRFARMKPPELEDVDLSALVRETAILLRGRVPPGVLVEGGVGAEGRAGGGPQDVRSPVPGRPSSGRHAAPTPPGGRRTDSEPGKPRRIRIDLDVIENAKVRADPKLLTQVFLNLGINALEALEKRGGTLSISCRDSRSVRHAPTPRGGFRVLEDVRAYEVTFEDTGDGIPASDLSKIFEPFYTTKPGGTGLGLAIAERIVKEHGGTITAESMPLSGATFRVRLPAAERVA